jgi:amino acid transporter
MYCPSCGAEYSIELKYCNRCGANLSAALEEQPQTAPVNVTRPALIIGAIMTILTILGFGMVITGAIELGRNPRIDPDSVMVIVVVGMLAILTMDIFLARLLSRIISASLSSNAQVRPKRTNMIANPSTIPLPQPSTSRLQGVPSVTEGTTRFFEPYRTPAEAENDAEKVDR